MRADIHPEYRYVVFRDVSCDFEFLTRSTIKSKETTVYNGEEYPLVQIDISSQSHPFYTGTQKIIDTEGRVERFYRKYGFASTEEQAAAEEGAADEAKADSEGEA